MLDRRIQAREPPVQNIRQLETALHQEWQQLSQQDIRLTDLVDGRLLSSQCCLSTGMGANGIRLTKRCNALSSRSDVTRDLPDLGKSFTLLVCVCFLTSRLTTVY
jgi:hypothetical protein